MGEQETSLFANQIKLRRLVLEKRAEGDRGLRDLFRMAFGREEISQPVTIGERGPAALAEHLLLLALSKDFDDETRRVLGWAYALLREGEGDPFRAEFIGRKRGRRQSFAYKNHERDERMFLLDRELMKITGQKEASVAALASHFGVSRSTVFNALKKVEPYMDSVEDDPESDENAELHQTAIQLLAGK
jgi:hypothetical protein